MSEVFMHTNDVNNTFTATNENSFFALLITGNKNHGSMIMKKEFMKHFHAWLGEQLGE